jgi:hypothetical protein
LTLSSPNTHGANKKHDLHAWARRRLAAGESCMCSRIFDAANRGRVETTGSAVMPHLADSARA